MTPSWNGTNIRRLMSSQVRSSSSLEVEPLAQRTGPARRQQGEHLGRDAAQPCHHHVRVGVVAQAVAVGSGIPLVELVRAHHPVDVVAIPGRVEVAIDAQKRAISSSISAPWSRRKPWSPVAWK